MRREQLVVVVARDEVDDRLLGRARDAMRMDVALATLGRLGREPVRGNREHELGGELDGVHELALRRCPDARTSPRIVTRTDAAENVSTSSSPRSEPSSVYATSAPNASRSKSSAPRPTSSSTVNATRIGARGRSGVAGEVRDRGHDLGDPGLVVGAEERRPVARHDVVADARGERRKHGGIEDLSRVAREHDRLTSPGLVDDRRRRRRRSRRASCRRAR